jgi:alkanesulfonate monooxygenase SsuD/methylene tetrahydromethanopterin reductase-like flavin-dependent oxidoreductase (luciferase family)
LATVCVWALAADTEDEAWRLFQSRARWKMDRNTGRIGALLPPDQAVRDYNASEQMAYDQLRAGALVGSASQVADKLRQLAERLQVDEVVIITWTHEPQSQAHSYALLAQEFNLKP